MKNKFKIFIIVFLLSSFIMQVKSQGWTQNRKDVYSVGVGVSQMIFLPFKNYPLNSPGSMGMYINMSGEYKVHRIIGIGWQTGVSVFIRGNYYQTSDRLYTNTVVVGVPIGFKLNVHILEATNVKVKDKLDLYAGFNAGAGPAFHSEPTGGVFPFIYFGPQIGVRYWVKDIAFFGELGWGATIANIGFSF